MRDTELSLSLAEIAGVFAGLLQMVFRRSGAVGEGESRGLACRPALDGAGLTAYGRDRREALTRGPCTGRRDRAEPLARPTRGCVP
jgi:hypothetical protein